MAAITDEQMRKMVDDANKYSFIILKAGPNFKMDGAEKIIMEHGRRNFSLIAEGKIIIACPVTDEGSTRGIAIINGGTEQAKKIMDDGPGVKAGIFTYEVHPCLGFAADCLK